MVTLGVDAHKRTHTIVAVDERGRQLAAKTIGTNTKDHLGLLTWAEQVAVTAGEGGGLLWAVGTAGTCHGAWSVTCSPRASPSCGSRRS